MDTHFGIAGAQNLNCTKIVVRLKVVLMMKLLLEILLNISQRSILPSSQQYQCASSLYNDFLQAKENALRALTEDWLFDTELISKVIAELKKLWACCWYKRTHSRAHPILSVVLWKLFRIIQLCKYVAYGSFTACGSDCN